MPIFDLVIPEGQGAAVLVEVPHAGLQIPDAVRDQLTVNPAQLLADSDLYVDALVQDAPKLGATLLTARVSRCVVDLNRSPHQVDARAVPDHPNARAHEGRGVVWRAGSDGTPILRAPLDMGQFETRIAAYYEPYHEALRAQISRLKAQHGFVIVLAAHSMPSTERLGARGGQARRADVVPGTQGRTSAAAQVIDAVEAHFEAADFSVAHDDPYKGGWTTAHYGDPNGGCHVLQLEINRALYVDEASSERRPEGMASLRQSLNALIETLADLRL